LETAREWRDAATAHNLTVEEFRQKIADEVKPLIDKSDVWVRIPPARLSTVLTDERFKSLQESQRMGPGKSGGGGAGALKSYLAARTSVEDKMFGTSKDSSASDRPIYGYLSDDPTGRGQADTNALRLLDVYGTAAVKLKASVQDRVTVTFGDSLDSNHHTSIDVMPALMSDPKGTMMPPSMYRPGAAKSVLDVSRDYAEAQIHGGVKTSDIAEIVFYEPPSAAVLGKVKKSGIPFRVIKRTAGGK
jgi:hypothetical protein